MKRSSKKNKLIINADDYGMSPLFNKGILELARKNIISSVSVMIKRGFIYPDDFKKLKNVSIGLHLELEEKDSSEKIKNQLKKFLKKFGKLPTHIDGHKHMHLAKSNLPKVLKIAKKYNLPVRSRLEEDRKIIRKAKIKTPDNFISWYPYRINKLKEKLKKAEKISELVCHPGYYDRASKYSYNLERRKELSFLKSKDFKLLIKKFEIINYYEL